ncbi:MAG: hypothetical protein ABI454_05685 [Sphingomicrobium sp.]
MTPKRANSDHKPSPVSRSPATARGARLNLVGDPTAERGPSEQSVFKPASADSAPFPAATRVQASALEGTIGAAIEPLEEGFYGSGSGALLTGAPLDPAPHSQAPRALRSRTNDLVAELRVISGQVNRMMSQVDRAIHRLGEHAGEPLRKVAGLGTAQSESERVNQK